MFKFILWINNIFPNNILCKFLWKYYWNRFWERERLTEKEQMGVLAEKSEIKGSERAELIEAIASQSPFDSLLEVACSCGQNFFTLAPMFPKVSFSGIDRDKEAVEEGRVLLEKNNISNVELTLTDARDLSMFEDNSFDVVISCAFMLYIWPDDVEPVLKEMFRVAKRKIIIMEQHQVHPEDNQKYIGTYYHFKQSYPGYWLRDYKELFKKYVSVDKIKIKKIPNPRFITEQWDKYASLVEVDVN